LGDIHEAGNHPEPKLTAPTATRPRVRAVIEKISSSPSEAKALDERPIRFQVRPSWVDHTAAWVVGPSGMDPPAYSVVPILTSVLTCAPGIVSTAWSAPELMVHCWPDTEDHMVKMPLSVPVAKNPRGPAVTLDNSDGPAGALTATLLKGAPGSADSHTAACSEVPAPTDPTTTVSPL
jgi:hypothetical protein